MTTLFLILLILFDVVILALFYISNKRNHITSDELLTDLSNEREILLDLKEEIKRDLYEIQSKNRSVLDRILQTAAEMDEEAKNSGSILKDELNKTNDENQVAFYEFALLKYERYINSIGKLEIEGLKINIPPGSPIGAE